MIVKMKSAEIMALKARLKHVASDDCENEVSCDHGIES